MSADIIMTTKELAAYIKLNEKTIIKMAQNRNIPGVKVGNQWRFHRKAIDAYLQQNVPAAIDEHKNSETEKYDNNIFLSRMINSQIIDLDVENNQKETVLRHLVDTAYKAEIAKDKEQLLSELKKREDMLSTAVGNFIALPHPRNPGKRLFLKEGIVVARTKKALEFGAPDKKAVRLFLMICALNESRHLKILATVAKFLQQDNLIKTLMDIKNEKELMRLLLAFDRNNNFNIEM